MTDEEFSELLGLGQENATAQRRYDEQSAKAKAMRGVAPQGRMVGDYYVAPHPMQLIGELAKEFSGNNLRQQSENFGANLDASMGKQNALVLRALQRNRAGAVPPRSFGGMPAPAEGPMMKPAPFNPYAGD